MKGSNDDLFDKHAKAVYTGGIMTDTTSTANTDIMTADEVAKFLRISPSLVRQRAREGTIPAYRIHQGERSSWRFRRSEIEKWLEDQSNK